MLDILFIKEHREIVERAIKAKGLALSVDLKELIDIYENRKSIFDKIKELKGSLVLIPENDTSGKKLIIDDSLNKLNEEYSLVDKKYIKAMLEVPNILSPDTPISDPELKPKILRQNGNKKTIKSEKSGREIMSEFGLISKIGQGGTDNQLMIVHSEHLFLRKSIASYIQYVLESNDHIKKIIERSKIDINPRNFSSIELQSTATDVILKRTARFDKDVKAIDKNIYFVSSEDVSPAILMDKNLEEDELPKRYISFDSDSKIFFDNEGHVKNRFSKLELRNFCLPEYSIQEQEFLVNAVEYLLEGLEIANEVTLIPSAELGLSENRAILISGFRPSKNNCYPLARVALSTSFESRRLAIKVKRVDEGIDLVHQCNAIIDIESIIENLFENNIDDEMRFLSLPRALGKYMTADKISRKK